MTRRGVGILGRNIQVAGGEIDILASVAGEVTVVEVRSLAIAGRFRGDPIESFGADKAAQVRRLAGLLRPPARRVDLIAVRFTEAGVSVRWVPWAA